MDLRITSKVLLLLVLLLFFSSVVVAFLFFLFFYIFIFSSTTHTDSTYQYMEVDVTQTKTRFGTTTLSQKLKEGEYVSYSKKGSKSHVFIKNFGGKEYKCTGSCSCKGSRRSVINSTGAIALRKGLLIFITALSVTLASKMAEESFQETCADEYSDDCDDETEAEADDVNCFFTDEKEDGIEYHYDCFGTCMDNFKLREVEDIRAAREYLYCEGQACDDYQLYSDLVLKGRDWKGWDDKETVAKFIFVQDDLDPYCHYQSFVKRIDHDACIGGDTQSNESLKCTLLEIRPEGSETKITRKYDDIDQFFAP